MIEISQDEYSSLKKAKADKDILQEKNSELTEKNKELGENIVKAKSELKEKHKKELLQVTTEKTALETQVKTFTEKLGVGEDVEDLWEFLDNISSDLSEFSKIKEEQEKISAENIQKYTDFIKSKDKEWEDYLSQQVDVFWEDVLRNERALKWFAEAKGFKEWEGDEKSWPIKVGNLEAGEKPQNYNSFAEAEKSGDLSWMADAFFGK